MSEQNKNLSNKEIEEKVMKEAIDNYWAKKNGGEKQSEPQVTPTHVAPQTKPINEEEIEKNASKETDPDLLITYEEIELPSKGKFYDHGIGKVAIEYLTSKDEDIMTTPSLIQSGKVMDVLLKRKIKTKGIDADKLLSGDRSAIVLFLRASSYGHEYEVQVTDPRTGKPFNEKIDLRKLKYKEITENPDSNGNFHVEIPMRKKMIKFKLLNHQEEQKILEKADAIKEAYGQEFSEFNTMKLKSHIISIDGKEDRTYIEKFVDAMPALDAFTIRKKILDVSPGIDMKYQFTAKDGYKFEAPLQMGIDFFFPSL